MNYNTLMLILTLSTLNSVTSSLNAVETPIYRNGVQIGIDFSEDSPAPAKHQFLPRINLSAPAPKDSFDFLPTESHLFRDICSDSQSRDCAVIRALFNQHIKIESLKNALTSKARHIAPYQKSITLACLKKAENDLEKLGQPASQALGNLIINDYEEKIRNEVKALGIIIDDNIEKDIKNSAIEKSKNFNHPLLEELKRLQNNIDFHAPVKKMVYTKTNHTI